LEKLKKQLDLTSIYGLLFLSDDPQVRSGSPSKSPLAHVTSLKQFSAAMCEIARQQKVELSQAKTLELHTVDEAGVEVAINGHRFKPKLLLVGGTLSPSHRKLLGIVPPAEMESP